MSKDRPRSVRLWPLACAAAVLWLLWVVSAHLPRTWRAGDHFYLSVQRGCVGVWYWSPAERRSLGIHDDLALAVSPYGGLSNRPFAWCDAWGFGLGTPLWLPALLFTALAARRYAVTTVRDAPPVTVRARRWMVVWVCAWGAITLGLCVSAGHREEVVLVFGGKHITFENGALVLERPDAPPIPTSITTTASSRLVFTSATAVIVAPSRQGWLYIDLLPDLHITPTSWRIAIPLWLPAVVLTWVVWRMRSAAAFKGAGLCRACGYNLAGLKSETACPECGTAPR